MTTRSASTSVPAASARPSTAPGGGDGAPTKPLLFDIGGINLSSRVRSSKDLEKWIQHRPPMAMLDWIVWENEEHTQAVGLKQIKNDEFWVPGHFPGRPMFPGVLMIETGAQLAAYLYNSRFEKPKLPAFTRIQDATFRAAVEPGDDLYILCKEGQASVKRFVSQIQGVVNGRVAFEALITGMAI